MQRTDSTGKAKSTHRRVESSTTLNRRYVKRPRQSMDMVTSVPVRRSPKIKKFNEPNEVKHVLISEMNTEETSAMQPEVVGMMQSEPVDMMQPDEMYGAARPEEMFESGMSAEMFGSMDPQEMVDSASPEELFASASPEEMSGMEQDQSIVAQQDEMYGSEMSEEADYYQAEQYYEPAMQEAPVAEEMVAKESVEYAEPHPLQRVANTRLQARKRTVTKKSTGPTAKELKERAIRQALASAATTTKAESKSRARKKQKMSLFSVGLGRVTLAFACAALAVFAIIYFVNANMPDISLKVAAMQTGINASYPSYVPRDYSISSITSENKRITLSFANGQTNEKFGIVEETSSWDSNALLSNYVKPTYGENYTTVKEQGLTIYISGSNAAWVNGGVMYAIKADGDTLTNKQIRSIATSL